MKYLRLFNPFHKCSAEEMVQTTLMDYSRELLLAEASAAYHRKMSEFYKEGIVRLQSQLSLAA